MDTVFETEDVAAAEQMISDAYGRIRLRVTGGGHRTRIGQLGVTRHVALTDITFAMHFTGEGEPLGFIPIGRVRSGTVSYGHREGGTDNRAGDVFIACPADRPYRTAVDHLEVDVAHIEPAVFARIADASPHRHPRPLRFTGAQPLTPAAAGLWSGTFDHVRAAAEDPHAAGSPLLLDALAQLLAATALTVFPHDGLRPPTAGEGTDAHPATLRRAVAFIDDNAHRAIAPADIAAAAHVTIRTLQLAFRRHLGTTPMGYLRRVRLEHAHRELLAAEPATGSVRAIAGRWGFANHSRFTATYRATFGVTPSHTLRHG